MKIPVFKPLLFLTLVLLLLGCRDSNNGDEDPLDPSDFPFDELMDESISSAFIALDEYDGEMDSYLVINIVEEHEAVSFSIDGNPVELFGFGGSYFGEPELTPAQTFSFELAIDGATTTGSLTLPGWLQADFPAEFDFDSDYNFSWSIDDNPDYFIPQLDIDHEDELIYDMKLLTGDKRSHTFSQSFYNGLSWDQVWEVDVGVMALNFLVLDDMVFLGAFDRYKWYPDDEERGRVTERRRGRVRE